MQILVIAALAAGLVAAARGSGAPAATTRVISMTAVEYKGSTEVAKEPFPTSELPGGGGYLRKEPKDGK